MGERQAFLGGVRSYPIASNSIRGAVTLNVQKNSYITCHANPSCKLVGCSNWLANEQRLLTC